MTAEAVIRYYLDIFVASYEHCTDKIINISSLIKYRTNWSPVNLPYEDKAQSIKNLGAAIIVNFTNANCETVTYPKRGLDSLTKIIKGSTTSADVVAQQLFMVHITKRKMMLEQFLYLMSKTEVMTVNIFPTNERVQWVQLVKKVVHNMEINKIIDACVMDFGLAPHRSSDEEEEDSIKVILVENGAKELRGFAGFDEIYIHATHFQDKIDTFSEDVELLQLICKIDLISLSIHELSHIKIRKSDGNFNMHTPVIAALKGLASNCNEFGIYTEKRFFECQVDWFKSAKNNREFLDIGYIEAFINAVERDTKLPPLGQIEGALPRVEAQGMGGADLQLFNDYIC